MNTTPSAKRPLWSYFYWPIVGFVFIFVVTMLFKFVIVANFSVTKQQVEEPLMKLVQTLPGGGMPTAITDLGDIDVQLRDGAIYKFVEFHGEMLGRPIEIQLVAAGKPIYDGPGFWDALYEYWSGEKTVRQVRYFFYDFQIVPDTFKIDGEPAIAKAVQPGQQAMETFTEETGVGSFLKGAASGLGFDTSDAARDVFTENLIYAFEDELIRWFSQRVENQINNKILYTFGENPVEQVVSTFFQGFDIKPDTIVFKFGIAYLFATIAFVLFFAWFGIGYFIGQSLKAARDRGLVSELVSDDVADAIGEVTDTVLR